MTDVYNKLRMLERRTLGATARHNVAGGNAPDVAPRLTKKRVREFTNEAATNIADEVAYGRTPNHVQNYDLRHERHACRHRREICHPLARKVRIILLVPPSVVAHILSHVVHAVC